MTFSEFKTGSTYGTEPPRDQYGNEVNEEEIREVGRAVRTEILERLQGRELTPYSENSRSKAHDRPQSVGEECEAISNGQKVLVRKVTQYRNEGGGWERYMQGDEQVIVIVEPRGEGRAEGAFERAYASRPNGEWDVWLPERISASLAGEAAGRPNTESEFAERALRRALERAAQQQLRAREPLHVGKAGIESLGELLRGAEFAD